MSGLQYISGSKHYEQQLFPTAKLPDEPTVVAEIGDSKQPNTFFPQVKLQRFGNAANVSFRYIGSVNGKFTKRLGKVTQAIDGGKVEIYDKPDEQAYEIELVFNQIPVTNSFPFSYRTKGVTGWDYQPALADEDVKEGCERPENVIGSYALSGPHGKLFHLYRPHVVDADGNEVWGELQLDQDNQKIEVVVDPLWLRDATYPVRIDPTIGYTSVGASSATFAANQPFASKMAGVSGTSSLTDLYGYRQVNAGTANFKIVLYDSDGPGGGPGTLLHSTAGQSCGTTAQWQSYSLALDVTSDFWIMQVADATCKFYFDTSALEGTRLSGVTAIPGFYVSPDNPWAAPYTIKTNLYSQYAVYSAGPSMTGTVSLELDVAGVMVIAPVMENSMEIELSTTGNLLVSQPMTEDVAVYIGTSGEMLVPVLMSGNSDIELSAAGTLLADESVSGDVGVELAVSGDMDQPSGTVRIGKIVVGSMRTIGATQWNIKLSTIDYSKNITDDFGKTFRSVGKYAPQIEGTARAVSREDIDGIMTTFRDARATDCVWDFNENNFDLSALIVYGLLAEHYMIINQPNDYTIKFRIDGAV